MSLGHIFARTDPRQRLQPGEGVDQFALTQIWPDRRGEPAPWKAADSPLAFMG